MSEHVTDRLPELLAGRLGADEEAAVRGHLADCPECAADLRWAEQLTEDAMRKGIRHPTPERLVQLAEGGGPAATPAETAHLSTCADCARERAWLVSLPPVEAAEAELAAGRGPRAARVIPMWLTGVAIAAAAAIVALFVIPHGRVARDVGGLARLQPLPVHVERGAVSPGFDEHRLDGLERYAAGDWSAARESLRLALEERPDSPEVRLYLGSAEVLAGERAAGRNRLAPLAAAATPSAFRDEALWILANLDLADGKAADAGHRLEALAAGEGRHATAARKILEELGSRH